MTGVEPSQLRHSTTSLHLLFRMNFVFPDLDDAIMDGTSSCGIIFQPGCRSNTVASTRVRVYARLRRYAVRPSASEQGPPPKKAALSVPDANRESGRFAASSTWQIGSM